MSPKFFNLKVFFEKIFLYKNLEFEEPESVRSLINPAVELFVPASEYIDHKDN